MEELTLLFGEDKYVLQAEVLRQRQQEYLSKLSKEEMFPEEYDTALEF